jgi:hypothetical protein
MDEIEKKQINDLESSVLQTIDTLRQLQVMTEDKSNLKNNEEPWYKKINTLIKNFNDVNKCTSYMYKENNNIATFEFPIQVLEKIDNEISPDKSVKPILEAAEKKNVNLKRRISSINFLKESIEGKIK